MRKTEQERLEALRKRQAQLKAKIGKIEAKAGAATRKEETRLKVVVGAALLADAKHNQATADFIKGVLPRAVTADRDKEFLQSKGWLAEAAAVKNGGTDGVGG